MPRGKDPKVLEYMESHPGITYDAARMKVKRTRSEQDNEHQDVANTFSEQKPDVANTKTVRKRITNTEVVRKDPQKAEVLRRQVQVAKEKMKTEPESILSQPSPHPISWQKQQVEPMFKKG